MTDRVPTLETGRVSLRACVTGPSPFAAMNADPRVMEHSRNHDRAQTDDQMERIIDGWRRGYGLWAAEERRTGNFIGFVGLSSPTWEAPFTPASRSAGDSALTPGGTATPPKPPSTSLSGRERTSRRPTLNS